MAFKDKRCTCCGVVLDNSNSSFKNDGGKVRVRSYCKLCHSNKNNEYSKRNKTRNRNNSRNKKLLSIGFTGTWDEYQLVKGIYRKSKDTIYSKYSEEEIIFYKRIKGHYKRIRKYGLKEVGDITIDSFKYLLEKQKGVCPLSGISLELHCPITKKKMYIYEIDHIIPLSKGGEHSINNIQLLNPIYHKRFKGL